MMETVILVILDGRERSDECWCHVAKVEKDRSCGRLALLATFACLSLSV